MYLEFNSSEKNQMNVWKDSIKSLVVDIVSRKFIVFICATILLVGGIIKADAWLYVALGYLTTNVLESSVINYFNKVTQ